MSDSTPANLNRPAWDIDLSHPDLVEKVTESLRSVVDPEIGLNIIQLGLIRNIRIDDNSAVVRMILTTPFCPYGPAMLENTRQRAEEALEIPTHMDLGMDVWDFSMMEEGLADGWGLY
jgi:metal-sulfur cluster biosynthetic enzyme